MLNYIHCIYFCRHNVIVCVLDNGRHGLHLKVCTHDYHNIICMSLVSSECVYFLPLTLFSLNLLFLPPPPLVSLNLEQNSLTSLSGLVHLNQLKVQYTHTCTYID